MPDDEREDVWVRWATLAMAALATMALEQAVLEPGRSRAMALASTLGVLTLPAVAAGWLAARYRPATTSRSSGAGRPASVAAPFLAMLGLFLLPFGIEGIRLLLTDRYAMAEVTLLAALRNLGLGLAVMAYRPVYARLSALVSLFLVTVASPVGGDAGAAVLAPVVGFAFAGTLWLMLVYWKGLGSLHGASARRFPLSGAVWVLAVVAVLAAVAAVGPTRAATALAGLVPTSGGTDWGDPEARSGVGDGDHEVSASEHPQSVGFTESDVYLETDRPSLYDAFNESYGEPFKPKKQEKMIALGQQDNIEQKERPAENLRAGREFPAVRKRPELHPRRPDERGAKALVYVKGPTPLHLPLTSYSHFDGTTWHEEPCCNRDFPAELEPGTSWLKLPWSVATFLAGAVAHQVKIGALDSSPMPVPPHLCRFRVGGVNRLDFFGWAQFGIVRMTGRTVPAGTVVDTEARTVDPEALREIGLKARPGDAVDHHVSFQGQYSLSPEVAALARGWVAGVPEGWSQVEAIVARLRDGFVHERAATASADIRDVVAEFLLRSRRGPDYLFASSAAVLLRSLGYPARVVSGLYAAPGRYDPLTRHTPVTRDDVHVWAEVRLPDGFWVAIEPTPGYELMPPVRAWHERVARTVLAAWRWARAHAAGLLVGLVALVALVARHRELLDRLATLAFRLSPARDPRRFILRALRLVECRARWAGRARPAGLTLVRWYQSVVRDSEEERWRALEGLVRLADWAVHAPDRPGSSPLAPGSDIEQTCRAAVRAWTLARFRCAIPPKPRKVATTCG